MDERLIILNDQGGAVMDITYEITATLRASMGGHAPIICCGFDLYNQSATGGVSKTLMASTNADQIPIICIEKHEETGHE